MNTCIALAVTDFSQVGEARRLAVGLAARLGFSEAERGRVAIVVTEAARNLSNHAQQGELLLRVLQGGGAIA